MEIKIEKAVLHVLDANASLPVYSQQELALESEESLSFLSAHIRRLFQDSAVKDGHFRESSPIPGLAQRCMREFLPASIVLADTLFSIMKEQPDIPSADLLVVWLTADGEPCLALLKLNYKTGYTHLIDYGEQGACTRLLVHRVIFASENQKIDEAALVFPQTGLVRVLEKPFLIDGHRKNYLSELYLQCDTLLSAKESLKIIDTAVKEISEKYEENPFERSAAVKTVLYEHLEEKGSVDVEEVARAAFEESSVMRKEYLQKVREAGVAPMVQPQEENPEKRFRKCKIRAENGIELNVPMELYQNKDVIEFLNQPDGTVAILIKQVGKLKVL